ASQDYKIPCTVNFINQSAQAYSYAWWFGTDSSITTINKPGSIAQNPSYIYNRPGTFIVTLRAFTETHKEWATMVQTITIRDTLIQSTNK
ncbi:MAG: PKD domain-containing protein, partial [Bacteroidota bacterium]